MPLRLHNPIVEHCMRVLLDEDGLYSQLVSMPTVNMSGLFTFIEGRTRLQNAMQLERNAYRPIYVQLSQHS